MAMNMIWDLECEEDYMDYIDIDLGDEVLPQDYIPGLPEEIAMECLLRVSHMAFPQLQGVCKKWGELVTGKDFYEERKRVGATQNCICILQALPEIQTAGQSGKHQSAPVFGLSVYYWQEKRWSRLPPIPDFPHGLPVFCRVVGVNGKLILLGGWHPSTYEPLRDVFVFNFSTRMWKKCADMRSGRSFFACGALGSRVFVAGGHDDDKNALATAEVYSPEEDRWESLPDMSEERDECGAVVLDGKLTVISGYSTPDQGQFVSSAEVYDPRTGCWSRVEGMWKAGVSPGLFAISQGQLYAIQKTDLVRYCPEKNVWLLIDTLPQDWGKASCATAICDNLFLMTLPDSGDRLKSCIHKRSLGSEGIGKWQEVEYDEEFDGIGRASCAVDV